MAHHKQRKRSRGERRGMCCKWYKAAGVSYAKHYEWSRINVRQRVKRQTWDGWE